MYRDSVIGKVIQFFNTNGPAQLKGRYVEGDVLLPAKSDMPLCYLARDETRIVPANNMEDEHQIDLVANVIYDMTDDFNQSADLVAGVTSLYEIMEARKSDYTLKPDTLLYQVRLQEQVEPKFWIGVGNPVVVSYGIGVERRGPGIFSVEAVMRFTVRLHLPRAGL